MKDGAQLVVGTWTCYRSFTGGGLFKELELRSDGSFRYVGRYVEDDVVQSNAVVVGTWRFDVVAGEFYETTTLWNGATANDKCVLTVAVADNAALKLRDARKWSSPLAADWVRGTS